VKLSILIAEVRDIVRTGLRTIFLTDERIEQIYEASNKDDLRYYLNMSPPLDLIIVNEALIWDITLLPQQHFIILTDELNIQALQAAYKQQAKGYLLENASIELLRVALGLPEGAFLLEPTITTDVLKYLTNDMRFSIEDDLLTRREKEIIELLRKEIDRRSIAQQLHISEATLKTHIKNIARKREKRNAPYKIDRGSLAN
jgi:DNA-binding NarL/FixJ family response regulator